MRKQRPVEIRFDLARTIRPAKKDVPKIIKRFRPAKTPRRLRPAKTIFDVKKRRALETRLGLERTNRPAKFDSP